MLTVRIIDQPAQFDALANAWDALLAAAPTDSVFLTHEWLRLWWRSFASSGDSLCVAAVFRDGELCAAAPLRLSREAVMRLPVRVLRSLTNEHTPKYDWLWRSGDVEAIAALLDAIRRQVAWDVFRLDYVPGGSATLAALERYGRRNGLHPVAEWCISSPYLPVQGAWEEYLASLSGNFRTKTRQADRKLRQAGAFEVVEVRGGPQLKEALRQAYAVEQSSWKGEAGSAIANRPNEERFYTDLAETAAERSWFRLFLVYLDGRPIAFDYCLDYKRTLNLVKVGYDPAVGKYSPGTVLRQIVLQQLFEGGGHDKYDMLGAASEWKLRWSQQVQDLQSAFMFRRSLRGAAAYELQFGIKRRLERYPRVTDALRRIKARWAVS